MSIEVERFQKSYDNLVAVDDLTFRVEPGEILGLVGPNGAGKTTTLRSIAGILRPSRGRILIDGHDVVLDAIEAKRALAYVPDEPGLFEGLSVWEHLRFIASAYRVDNWQSKGERLLAEFELVEKRDALVSELSRGMRQKTAIACGFLHDPRAILLDEPLTGLDPRGIRTMQSAIRERALAGAAVVVSSHLLSLVEDLCTSLLVLQRGRMRLREQIAVLRSQMRAAGRAETLEDLFFELTEGSPDDPAATTANNPIVA